MLRKVREKTIPNNTPTDYAKSITKCWYQNPDERSMIVDDVYDLIEIENLNIREVSDYEFG